MDRCLVIAKGALHYGKQRILQPSLVEYSKIIQVAHQKAEK